MVSDNIEKQANEQQSDVMTSAEPIMIRVYNDGHKGATAFFRNRAFLDRFVSLLDRMPEGEVRVLVHASSVGAEPYSLALWWLHRIGARKALKIFSTDLDAGFLQVAQAAVYPAEILDGMSSEEQGWFESCDGGVRVAAGARSMVTFLPAMSFVDGNPGGAFDAVLIMNALTYVTPQQQGQAIANIASYTKHLMALTAFHPDNIRQDIERVGFVPDGDALECIHAAWGDRLSAQAISPDSPDYAWRLPPFDAEHPDAAYRFCSIFLRSPQMHSMTPELKQALDETMQLATQRHQAGDLANAEKLYGKVLEFMPEHAPALHNLGLIYLNRGDTAAAELLLSEAVRQNPNEATFHYNLALALQQQKRLVEAELSYAAALRIRPAYREAWENRGVVLQDLERFDEAEQAYRQALVLFACSRVANRNLGNILRVLGRMDEAVQHYLKAMECSPLDGEIAFGYGSALLATGDYVHGWRWSEWRYWSPENLEKSVPCRVPLPKWDGSNLAGRHVLTYGEQGIGDEIMFASCLNDLTAQAQGVTLLCEARLAPLFARSFPAVRIVSKGATGKVPTLDMSCECDCRISLASLPQFFRKNESSFPKEAYLIADQAAVAAWRQKLAALGKPLKVGISWRGGIEGRAKVARSLDLQLLAPLFERQDAVFVNVQYGCYDDEIAAFNRNVANPLICFPEVDPLREMDDFAALLSALDLVISVDNSTVHLAGALGVPTWVMLPAHADCRWLRGRADALWYPTLRLFWQEKFGKSGWPEVVANIAEQLQRGVEASRLHVPVAADNRSMIVVSELGEPERPLALMLNDTTYWYHWGCSATSLALHEGLRAAGYRVDSMPVTLFNALSPLPGSLEDFDDDAFYATFCAANRELVERISASDLVFINGEGSLHGFGHVALALLYTAYIAKCRLHKITQIVNHSCYPRDQNVANGELADAIYAKVYGVLDFIAVREDRSLQELARIGIAATRSFDCLPLYVQRHPAAMLDRSKRVVIAGSVNITPAFVDMMCLLANAAISLGYEVQLLVGANAYLAADDVLYAAELHQRLKGRYTLIDAQSEAEWLGTIAEAALLVSGRFHHTIAAASLGTPVLVAASNTAKIEGLLERLQLSAADVWLDSAAPQQALEKLRRVLVDASGARVTDAALAALRELAACNFDGLKLS